MLEKTGQSKAGAGDLSINHDTVWFDDIGLWPIRCVPAFTLETDFTEDCVVNEQDFDIMANAWLMTDYNTTGYPGTLIGFDDPDAAWYPAGGVDGGALYFPSIVDSGSNLYCEGDPNHSPEYASHVEVPTLGLNSNTVSMTAWIKTDGIQCGYGTGIIFMRPPATGLNLFGDLLAYHWNDQHWGFGSGLYVPDNTWTFVALVVTPSSGTLYMDTAIAYDTVGK